MIKFDDIIFHPHRLHGYSQPHATLLVNNHVVSIEKEGELYNISIWCSDPNQYKLINIFKLYNTNFPTNNTINQLSSSEIEKLINLL
jgi:hypothetical protein